MMRQRVDHPSAAQITKGARQWKSGRCKNIYEEVTLLGFGCMRLPQRRA